MLLLFILIVVAVFCGAIYINNHQDYDNLQPPLEEVEQEDEFPDDK